MGVPSGLGSVATTRPYYASSYVFVYRARAYPGLDTLRDPRLRSLKVAIHLLEGESSPPELAFSRLGIVDNLVGFMIYGDAAQANPPARAIEAIAAGAVDLAVVWGPIGGYFAHRVAVPLTAVTIRDTRAFAPIMFRYSMAIGVRKTDRTLQRKLDREVQREQSAITAVLRDYDVPLVAWPGDSS
jgi:mxaJ protein